MKSIMVKEIGSFDIVFSRIREIKPDEVLIKVTVSGLCRTDLKIVEEGHPDLVLPRIPGEEVVGTVYAKGNAVRGIEKGQTVYVYPGIWCDECPACKQGAENLCKKMQIMGFHRHGGFAEYVIVPAQSVIPIPEGLSGEEAVFAEPLSCCLNALEHVEAVKGKDIGIWGAGPAGTLLARAATAHGGHPFSIELDPRRRKLIKGFWPVPNKLFDICIVAVGSEAAYQEALEHITPRGYLVVFSGLSRRRQFQRLNLNQLHYQEQKIVGAYGCCYRHGVKALQHIADGSIPVRDMISHRLSLWELEEALSIVKRREGMKVLLYP